nr:hypothetical protein [Tanacetum cinerariifolium]
MVAAVGCDEWCGDNDSSGSSCHGGDGGGRWHVMESEVVDLIDLCGRKVFGVRRKSFLAAAATLGGRRLVAGHNGREGIEDLEALWNLVKERFFTSKPKNFSDDFLLNTLGAMFEKPDEQAQV